MSPMGTLQNIILIGFMGSGKTTTGKELAKLLNRPFLDLDEFIEEACGMKIAKIFKEGGEHFFRKKESQAIDLLESKKNSVISTGGGVWQNEENRSKLLRMGLCVWLKVSPEKALKRIEANLSQRPLLAASENPLQTMTGLLMERETDYSKAHVIVVTNDKNPKQVAEEIAAIINLDGPFDLRSMQK